MRTKVKTAVEVGVAGKFTYSPDQKYRTDIYFTAVPPLDAAKINQKKDEAPIDEKAAR